VTPDPQDALLLRADLLANGRSVVAHTITVSESALFVRTDESAYIGDRMLVRLSFPGLVAPLELEAHVVSHLLASAPGEPAGLVLALVFRSEEEQDRLNTLIARANDGSAAAPPPASEVNQSASTTYRILLVEDSKLIQDMFVFRARKYFSDRGSYIHVDVADSAETAWQMLGHSSYDLAIVDYFLPTVNGEQLIARLRQTPKLANLPVLAISVGGDRARKATLAAGADMFLDKPIVLRSLFSTIDRLTTRRAVL
jgi:CheY-like chemotaxis protein